MYCSLILVICDVVGGAACAVVAFAGCNQIVMITVSNSPAGRTLARSVIPTEAAS